jgi:drug/metabolite transporter (DMT)-like permease
MRYRTIAGFLGLSLLWGSEWILTASVPAEPHLRALAIRYGLSAVLLLPWAIRRRIWRRPLRTVGNAFIVGIGILCLPQILIAVSAEHLSPAITLAAVGAVPVLLAISGRLTITTAVCGLGGVFFLVADGLSIAMGQIPWMLFPLAAAAILAWALAAAEKHLPEISMVEAMFGQFAISGLLLSIASLLLEHETVTWSATTGLGFVLGSAFMTVCGYLLFYWLLGKSGAGRVSMLQWAQPLVATAESVALVHIRPKWSTVAGAILIVLAIVWAFSNWDDQGVILEITQT